MPEVRPGWMDRPALVRRLCANKAKLALIDAPAGYGKTTLIAQWRGSSEETRPFGWVTLDPDDNDPVRLWLHVAHAAHRASPQMNLPLVLDALAEPAPAPDALPVLLNELAALAEPVVLVLDDYHMIKDRNCHRQVEYLLARLPPTVQLVLATRADPPLPLARLRATGDMIEIRMGDLRFTPGEASALVRRTAETELGKSDLLELVGRTEGWPAGVYLAALSLRGHPSPSNFIRQFSGDSRYIADLLVEEVLSRQPERVRQFLARTAILSQFSAPLCDTVLGSADAAEIIETLDRDNLFLVPVDENLGWYRYHRLFAQLLRSQLARYEPEMVPTLHRRASSWHRQSGWALEAISHALAAGDVADAVDLIAGRWFTYADAGRVSTVRGWLQALGDDVVAAYPLAAHCAVWVAALAGDRPSVARWLAVLEAADDLGPLPDGMASLRSSVAMLRGVHGFDGLAVMCESAELAAKLEGDPASPWYALARAGLGYSRYLSGDADAAAAVLEEAVLSGSDISFVRQQALSGLCLATVAQGRLERAAELAAAARELVGREDMSESPLSALAYLAEGALHAAERQYEQAHSELEHALRLRRKVPGVSPWPTIETLLTLAEVRIRLRRQDTGELLGQASDMLALMPDGAQVQLARLGRLEQTPAGPALVPVLEPLTEREITVLRLLRGTLSLREIGQALHLSPNTVKTHTRVIYRKLGVTSRSEAVEYSRKLDIL